MEGVIYQHTVETFIARVLLRRGLLSLEFDRELRAMGVDASRPKEMSLELWTAMLRATAKRMSPGKAPDDAVEELGREMIRGYRDGLVGRGLFVLLRMLGPRRALLRVKENFNTGDNVTKVKARELSPTCVELEFETTSGIPTWSRGILLEALQQLKVRDPKVEFRMLPSMATVFTVSWA